MANTPQQRKAQADVVRSLANDWETAANLFDAKTTALEAAQDKSLEAGKAYNQVAWMLSGDARGVTDEQKIEALQLKIAADKAAALVPPLFQAATDASQARGSIELAIDKATDQLKDNPGAVEKV